MQWIDANTDAPARHPIPGVNYRSECHRFRVAAESLSGPPELREWSLWDMTGAAPMVLMSGFKSSTVAMRAGGGVAASRGLRVVLRLAAIGRAVAAGVRRLTA